MYCIETTEIVDESHYYPFGLKHSGYVTAVPDPNYKYKYNGKELQDELGLNMYDYGARNYDPALGRWMNIDPLAEMSRRFSPYTYAVNNPVYFIDVDGMYAYPGDFLDSNGQNIGNDGIDDGKTYVIKTTQSGFESFNTDSKSKETVSSDGISESQKDNAVDFVQTNAGETKAFNDKPDIYNNFVELPSAENRKGMSETVSADDGSGGKSDANNREYGGRLSTDPDSGKVTNMPGKPGEVMAPGNGGTVGFEYSPSIYTTSVYHDHPSGTNAGTTIQPPSTTDYKNAYNERSGNNMTNYVFGKGSGQVYIYSTTGVQATIPINKF
jgi:RHS repeat-associated protein